MTKSSNQISTLALGAYVLENTLKGIIVVDNDGTIAYTNPSFDQLVGYEAGALISQNIAILYPTLADGKSSFHSHVLPELQKTGAWQGELTTIKRGGQQFGLTARFSHYKDENQNYWIGFHKPLIELENTKIGPQHVPMKKLLDVMPDTFEVFDPHSMTYLLWNQAANKFSGRTDQEIAEMDPSVDYLDPADLPRVNAAIERAMAGNPGTVKTTVIHKDGRWIPLEYTVAVIRDSVGWPLYVVAVGRDIREQLKTEEALRQSEGQYRDLVEKISDVIYSADTNGVITYINPAIENLLGYLPEEVVGKSIVQFVYPEDLEKAQRNIQSLLSADVVPSSEYRLLTAEGEVHWIHATSQPTIQEGNIVGIQGVITDITERKKLEKQHEQEAMAAERERLARRLHDAVTQTLFSASVMAESTPRVLANDPELANQNLIHLSVMLRGALAEMRTMLIELRPSALIGKPLGDLLQTLAEANQGKINGSVNVTIEDDTILPDEVTIVFYRTAQEAFSNITKYAGADVVNIHFGTDEGKARLMITDNGRGFEQDKIPPGHYGLKIMAERVDQIGGELKVESSPEGGTQVVVDWSGQIQDVNHG